MLAQTFRVTLLLPLALFLSACDLIPLPRGAPADDLTPTPAAVEQSPDDPTSVPQTPPSQALTVPAPAATAVSLPPTIVEYNLGESTIPQEGYGDGDPFHDLPLRLDGLIGVPASDGPHPLILILHGDHAGCAPDPETGKPLWPCAREKEQPNYHGFEYLIEELVAHGYVALAININAAYTEGFGDGDSQQRLSQIIDLHLDSLIAAGQGGANPFGVDLYGRIDPVRIVWIAHSTAADLANQIIRDRGLHEAIGAAYTGYGPVQGLLLAAPVLEAGDALPPAGLPLAVLLPACDGRSPDLAAQAYFEEARTQPQRQAPAASVLLAAANHNQFNEFVPPDMLPGEERPTCRLENLQSPAEQRAFLARYAAAFASFVTAAAEEAGASAAELGLNPAAPVPGMLFERDVLLAVSPQRANEELLLRPSGENERTRNLAGGEVLAENLDLTFCPPGTAVHEADSTLAGCHRLGANHPANPAQMLLRWDSPSAALRLTLPEGGIDLRSHAALHLRAALDPLSNLNQPGQGKTFGVALKDAGGRSARTAIPAGEPALAFPAGDLRPGNEGQLYTGHVQMSALRVPLDAFAAIDLSAVTELVLHFDLEPSGALFIADLGFIRPPRYPGSYSTLLSNDGSLDHLRGIGRLHGSATCTATLIDTGAPQAPAVLLSSGHCAQQWSANDVNLNSPAANMQVVFNYFANTRAVQIAIPAARVLYSTMKGRDIALIELAATQEELQTRDIMPFKLAGEPPEATAVTVIGAPVAELPSDAAYLRREGCEAGDRVSLLEYEWQFVDAYRLDCRDIYGGSSGSPVFAAGSQEIFAIVNTTTNGGQSPCRLNAPCEISPSGVAFSRETSYATAVDSIAACFETNGTFDLALPGCPLDDSRQLTVSGTPQHAVRPSIKQGDGIEVFNTWNARLGGDLPYYRYKTGPAGEVDCHDERDYSDVLSLAERPLINDALPKAEGYHVLCLLAGPTPELDDAWQQPRFATSLRVEIDTTPPVAAPSIALSATGDDLLVQPDYDPPEITAVDYKVGPIAAIDCADPAGYASFGIRPLTIPASDLPAMICLIARDAAGNPGQPVREIINSQ